MYIYVYLYAGNTVQEFFWEVSGLEWSPDTWMVEYGQGFIPFGLCFGLSDTIFNTVDLYSLYQMLTISM